MRVHGPYSGLGAPGKGARTGFILPRVHACLGWVGEGQSVLRWSRGAVMEKKGPVRLIPIRVAVLDATKNSEGGHK